MIVGLSIRRCVRRILSLICCRLVMLVFFRICGMVM